MRNFNFSGIKSAKVIRNDDPEKRQRIAVWIPELMPTNTSNKPNDTSQDTSSTSTFHLNSPTKPTGKLNYANYVWVNPCIKIDAGPEEAFRSGVHSIPRKGTWVSIFFQDEDPQKPRYLPFGGSPTNDEKVELVNLSESEETKEDPAKRPNIFAFEFPNGTILGVDYNPEVNSFIMRINEGHTIKIISNDKEDQISVYTPKGRSITLDDKNDQTVIKDPASVLVDSPDVTVECTNAKVNATDIKIDTKTKTITAKMLTAEVDVLNVNAKIANAKADVLNIKGGQTLINCEMGIIKSSGPLMIKGSPVAIN